MHITGLDVLNACGSLYHLKVGFFFVFLFLFFVLFCLFIWFGFVSLFFPHPEYSVKKKKPNKQC